MSAGNQVGQSKDQPLLGVRMEEVLELKDIQRKVDTAPSAPGLAVIVSIDYISHPKFPNLMGTKKDGDAMEKSFKGLNYSVVRKHNTSLPFLIALLTKVGSDIRYPPSYKRIAFVFAGHGQDGGMLITSEGHNISVATIIERLSPSGKNASTTQLGSMARLFFIDACRGDKDDLGLLVTPRGTTGHNPVSRGGNVTERLRIPSEPTNIIVAYSTVSGYRSYEIKNKGGIWLQCLAAKLVECDCSIGDVLGEVNGELMKLWQENKDMKVMNPELYSRLSEQVNLFREKENQVLLTASTETRQPQAEESQHAVYSTSKSSKPKILLAPNFNPQRLPSTTKPEAVSTTPPPVSAPQVALTRNQDLILCRQGTVPKEGFYRAQLNDYKMRGIISTYKTSSHQNDQSWHSTVSCKLKDGPEIIGDSIRYITGKKAISEENAAKNAVEKIKEFLQSHCGLSSTVTHHDVLPSESCSKSKVYKGKLNNYLFQKQKLSMPEYRTIRDEEGQFQCTIMHSSIGQITGSKYSTKKEAEDCAALRAWLQLGQDVTD